MRFMLLKGGCNTSSSCLPTRHLSSARGAGGVGGMGGNGVATNENPSHGLVPAGNQISDSLRTLTILWHTSYARSGGVQRGLAASL